MSGPRSSRFRVKNKTVRFRADDLENEGNGHTMWLKLDGLMLPVDLKMLVKMLSGSLSR